MEVIGHDTLKGREPAETPQPTQLFPIRLPNGIHPSHLAELHQYAIGRATANCCVIRCCLRKIRCQKQVQHWSLQSVVGNAQVIQ